jgi:hypothetical protein
MAELDFLFEKLGRALKGRASMSALRMLQRKIQTVQRASPLGRKSHLLQTDPTS